MSDGFERFGITHLSASSLNKWASDRGAWVASYIYKLWDDAGAAAWRGKAVEAGLDAWMSDRFDVEQCHAKARDLFELEAAGLADDKTAKERESIGAMLDQAIAAVTHEGLARPEATQIKCEWWAPGVGVPIIGYCDYTFAADDPFTLDLKTTHRMPSEPQHDHMIQAGNYALARGERQAKLLYVTTKKSAVYTLDEAQVAEAGRQIQLRARSLARTLDRATDADDLATMCPPNLNHPYMWSDPDYVDRVFSTVEAWRWNV